MTKTYLLPEVMRALANNELRRGKSQHDHVKTIRTTPSPRPGPDGEMYYVAFRTEPQIVSGILLLAMYVGNSFYDQHRVAFARCDGYISEEDLRRVLTSMDSCWLDLTLKARMLGCPQEFVLREE